MRRLALIAALIVLAAPPQARAAVPGDACTGAQANQFTWSALNPNTGFENGMFCNGSTWQSAINFQSTGFVGIGTTSPGNLLQVAGTPAGNGSTNDLGSFVHTSSAAEGVKLGYYEPGGGGTPSYSFLRASGNIPFALGTSGGNTQLYLLTNGNVGIAQTTPATKLDVNGDITNENVKSCAQLGTDSTGKLICQTPAMTLISTQTASASASLIFNGATWSSSYNTLFMNCQGIRMSASGNSFYFRVGEGGGPTWETAGTYAVSGQTNTGTDIFNGVPGQPVGTTSSYNFLAYINSVSSATLYKPVIWMICESDAYNGQVCGGQWAESWWRGDTNAITGLELVPTAGTIASGTCSLYGMN